MYDQLALESVSNTNLIIMVEDFFKFCGYLLGFLGTGKTGRTGSYLSKIGTGNSGTGSGTVEALVTVLVH